MSPKIILIPTSIVLAILKTLGIRWYAGEGNYFPARLSPLDFEDLPDHAALKVEPLVHDWEHLGFRLVGCFECATPGASEAFEVDLLDPKNTLLASVVYTSASSLGRRLSIVSNNCSSRLADGTVLGSSSQGKKLLVPPQFKGVCVPGASAAQLLDRQKQMLDDTRSRAVAFEESSLRDTIRELNDMWEEFAIDRGIMLFSAPQTSEGKGLTPRTDWWNLAKVMVYALIALALYFVITFPR